MNTTENPIALFDMDGTLFDYNSTLIARMQELRSPNEPEFSGDKPEPWERARMDLIKNTPGFWLSLPPIKAGFEILEAAVQTGFRIVILTAGPVSAPIAWAEKVQCCQKHLKDLDYQVTITRDKGLVYGAVLVDDWPPYGEAWLKHRPRGTLIVPAQPWNEGFGHPQLYRYTGNKTEVKQLFEGIKTERLKAPQP